MKDSEFTIRARRKWVELYAATQNATLVCRRSGISEPTLRKWRRRFQSEGEAGLHSRSTRPHHSPGRKLTDEHGLSRCARSATLARAASRPN